MELDQSELAFSIISEENETLKNKLDQNIDSELINMHQVTKFMIKMHSNSYDLLNTLKTWQSMTTVDDIYKFINTIEN